MESLLILLKKKKKVMLTREKEDYLREIYLDPSKPTSFGGADKLYHYVKDQGYAISRSDIKKWLSKQSTYSLYRKVVRKFKRAKVIAPSKQYMLDSDTANYEKYASSNDGYKYIAVFIDILSHYLYTVPLKSLTSREMADAMKKVFESNKPTLLRSDRGKEYADKATKYMKDRGVKHITTSDHSKANYAERVIRTIKTKLGRYMTYNKTRRWIDALADVTNSYNNTYHRTIKMSPKEALVTKDPVLWKTQYETLKPGRKREKATSLKKMRRRKPVYKFQVGDVVRLSKLPGTFDKETDQKWTDELFRITTRSLNQGIPKYVVKDFDNDPIIDQFSNEELQKVLVDEGTHYDVDEILRKRKRNGKTQLLVHWVGWPSKFDSWIDEDQLKDFSK